MLIKSEALPLNKKVHPGNFKGWIVRDDPVIALLSAAFQDQLFSKLKN